MKTLAETLAMIEEQQKALTPDAAPWCVGEQLKDIIKTAPELAPIVGDDLDKKGFALTDCEKKIAGFAKKHAKNGVGFCGHAQADKIIREFYGLTNVRYDAALSRGHPAALRRPWAESPPGAH